MSVTKLTPRPETQQPASPTRSSVRLGGWVRVVLVCAVLLGSWAVRARQEIRIQRDLKRGLESPLKLESVPMEIGPWKGQPTELDPRIARGTGADQIVTRRYVNQNTGVAIDVILLFGPAVEMYIHKPEACYPQAGFGQVAGPDDVSVATGQAPPKTGLAPFRSLLYSRGEGALADRQEVVYSWRYNGRWTPNVGVQKHFERISGMYKLHVSRSISRDELEARRRGAASPVDAPCQAFLDALLPEIERRIPAPDSA